MVLITKILIVVAVAAFIAVWLRGSHYKRQKRKAEQSLRFERNRAKQATARANNAKKMIEVAHDKIKRDERVDVVSRGNRTDLGTGMFDGTASGDD